MCTQPVREQGLIRGGRYRWDDGEGKRVKAWWLMTNDPQTELDWLRADIYGDDRRVTVLKARQPGAIRRDFGLNSSQHPNFCVRLPKNGTLTIFL